MVEATTKFFAFRTEAFKPPISADDAHVIENFRNQLLSALKNQSAAKPTSSVVGAFA